VRRGQLNHPPDASRPKMMMKNYQSQFPGNFAQLFATGDFLFALQPQHQARNCCIEYGEFFKDAPQSAGGLFQMSQ
jgi:hypothetical protein